MCYAIGREGLMVCQTLVAIAAHTTSIWDHVTPNLMAYLESKADAHHEILVSFLSLSLSLSLSLYTCTYTTRALKSTRVQACTCTLDKNS